MHCAAPPEPKLRVSVGQHSENGRKAVNQDFYGFRVPAEPQLSSKGIAVALADGIGSSEVSQVAAEFAVMGFLDDYYCTPESWSVRRSVDRVLDATNSWLHSRTQQSPYRYEQDRGYVCTLSGLVFKSTSAHVFHVGDTRVYRLQGNCLEQLTQDHRVCVAQDESYLSRAVGFNRKLEIDYHALEIQRGDVFVLMTDGVYEHLDAPFIARVIREQDPDAAARAIVAEAYRRGSADNLTVQIVTVSEVPGPGASEVQRQLARLAPAPLLEARAEFDGYRILREIHASARSHIYLAQDLESQALVALKTPSTDMQEDRQHLERFLMEEWIARRLNSPHVLKPCLRTRERRFLYVAMEHVEGRTLAQWMSDHPRPDLEQVRGIVEQIARGLQAFHRMEMLHQDLRPPNIMIDRTGTVKIIDFGSARVAGVEERAGPLERAGILGALQYTAPEYFVGDPGSERSDLYSLGVIAYRMLSGRLPYGAAAARIRSRAAQRRLQYETLAGEEREVPAWVDAALRKAVHPDPRERYASLSEFVYDLRHPNAALLRRPSLAERNPLLFWKGVSFALGVALFLLLLVQFGVKTA
ncbi:MAG TPA: bifunctional protein-serine/threonine kinase/phosphatase [Burkholderiales bacterium]|nr:bifunctional protein-serine/threonine kinase/phosphatase [Burkholderiales bacterium]